jgi:hypothetical protein
VPSGVLTCSTHEFEYAWRIAITAAPADPPAVLAAHSRGFRRPDHYVRRVRRRCVRRARLPGRR